MAKYIYGDLLNRYIINDNNILTGMVLSPKKCISLNPSFSTYCKQIRLSQPTGNTSKLICPPADVNAQQMPGFFVQEYCYRIPTFKFQDFFKFLKLFL